MDHGTSFLEQLNNDFKTNKDDDFKMKDTEVTIDPASFDYFQSSLSEVEMKL